LKRIFNTSFIVFIFVAILVFAAACDQQEDATPVATPGAVTTPTPTPAAAAQNTDQSEAPSGLRDDLPMLEGTMLEVLRDHPVTLLQLQPVSPGEELLVMHTNHGDITLRFFPTEAPMAVENFVTHAKNGYYDGVIFHRVIPNFMIQGGDPTGTGMGGESIWGGQFGQEFSVNLRHFRGALAMAQSAAPNSIGSQFYIVQNSQLAPNMVQTYNNVRNNLDVEIGQFEDGRILTQGDIFLPEEIDYFMNNGGTPHLDWAWNANGHTVFGHVVDGMDVVDAIAEVSRGANDRPNEDVIIIGFTAVIAE